jgi:DNA-binding transcriptional ArsR family regulator
MTPPSNHKRHEQMVEVFKALAEPQRIAILRLVHERELPAGEIASHFNLTRQAISQHLRLLTNAGLLELRRDGTKRLYRVRKSAFGDLRIFLDAFWSQSLSSLKRRVEQDKETRRGGK